MVDGGQYWLLAGPWKSHTTAKAWVKQTNEKAVQLDRKNWFRSFGTCSVKRVNKPALGLLNKYLRIGNK